MEVDGDGQKTRNHPYKYSNGSLLPLLKMRCNTYKKRWPLWQHNDFNSDREETALQKNYSAPAQDEHEKSLHLPIVCNLPQRSFPILFRKKNWVAIKNYGGSDLKSVIENGTNFRECRFRVDGMV